MNDLDEESHLVFRDYLSEVSARDLPALRHLLACPLCQEMTRLLLTPATPETASGPARRRRLRPGRRGASARRGRRP